MFLNIVTYCLLHKAKCSKLFSCSCSAYHAGLCLPLGHSLIIFCDARMCLVIVYTDAWWCTAVLLARDKADFVQKLIFSNTAQL